MSLKTSSFSIPWGILLKILVSGSLAVWLFRTMDMEKVWVLIQSLPFGILILTLTFIWGTLFAIAKRWQFVIRLAGINASFSGLSQATFIGAFFNQFLPSSVGGDFYRILAARRYGSSLNSAITGVFIDRLFGFISLGILCLFSLPLEGDALLGSDLKWPFLATMILLTGVLGGGGLLLLLPQKWHSHVFIRPFHAVIGTLQGALRQKGLFLSLLGISLVASLLVIGSLQILMGALGIPLTWVQSAAILPVILLLTSLPISFAGWGLREGAIVVAFGIYHVPEETALALSLAYGILHLASAVPGLVLWILEKRLQHLDKPDRQGYTPSQ